MHPGTGKLKLCGWMGNATCIFNVEQCIGGPVVEIKITVIANFMAMPACGCEDTECTIIKGAAPLSF